MKIIHNFLFLWWKAMTISQENVPYIGLPGIFLQSRSNKIALFCFALVYIIMIQRKPRCQSDRGAARATCTFVDEHLFVLSWLLAWCLREGLMGWWLRHDALISQKQNLSFQVQNNSSSWLKSHLSKSQLTQMSFQKKNCRLSCTSFFENAGSNETLTTQVQN